MESRISESSGFSELGFIREGSSPLNLDRAGASLIDFEGLIFKSWIDAGSDDGEVRLITRGFVKRKWVRQRNSGV